MPILNYSILNFHDIATYLLALLKD